MKKTGILSTLFILLFFTKVLSAQEIREEESLNYTYLGPVASFGYNKVEYRDWFGSSTETKKMSGYTVSGGIAVDIFADRLCGDFQMKYAYNSLDFTLTFLELSIAGKYMYPLNNTFSLGGGLGMYCQTPPSNKKYNGSGGIQVPLSMIVNTSPTTKFFVDIYYRYGSFGIGQNTSSTSAGVNAGFIFKVGRI